MTGILKTVGVIAAVVACAAPGSAAFAKYRAGMPVRYMTKDGWSEWYKNVDVTFVTGYELNNLTHSQQYNGCSRYAVIFWGQHQASVIDIGQIPYRFTCYSDFSQTDLKENLVSMHQSEDGTDQENREWEICTKGNCGQEPGYLY